MSYERRCDKEMVGSFFDRGDKMYLSNDGVGVVFHHSVNPKDIDGMRLVADREEFVRLF